MEDKKPVADRRKGLRLSQDELARRAGVHRNTVVKIESGRRVSSGNLQSVLFALDRAEHLLAELSDDERSHLELWRRIPHPLADHLEAVMSACAQTAHAAEPASAVAGAGAASVVLTPARVPVFDLAELRERNSVRYVRLVGDVAALSDPSVSFEDRQGGEENYPMPAELYVKDCQLVRAHGDSMKLDGIEEGDLLVVTFAQFGRRGRDVIAWTKEHGMVVKRYKKQAQGIIYLVSRGDGQDISGDGEHVQVRGIVESVYRER